MILGTCNAAEGGPEADNILEAMGDKGAQMVIGFTDAAYVSYVNPFIERFLDAVTSLDYTYAAAQAAIDYCRRGENFSGIVEV